MKRAISQKRLCKIIKEALEDVMSHGITFDEIVHNAAASAGLSVEECDDYSATLYGDGVEVNVSFDDEFGKAYVSSFKGGFYTGDPSNKSVIAQIYKLMEELEKLS